VELHGRDGAETVSAPGPGGTNAEELPLTPCRGTGRLYPLPLGERHSMSRVFEKKVFKWLNVG